MLQRFLVIQDHRITLFSDCAKNDIFVLTNHPIGILAISDFSNLKKMCSPDTLGLKMQGQVGTRPRNLCSGSKQMDQRFRRYGLFSSSVPRKIYLFKMTLIILVFHRICSTNCVTLSLQFQKSQLAPFFSENFCCLQKNQKNAKSSQNCRGVQFYNLYELFLYQFSMLIPKIVLILHHFQYHHEDSCSPPPHSTA